MLYIKCRSKRHERASEPNHLEYGFDQIDFNTTTGMAAALGCEAQASEAYQQAQTNAALWVPANFLLLDPLRNTFGPGKKHLARCGTRLRRVFCSIATRYPSW